ncbi:magnesium-dependent phosphatase 1 isoform X1 [Octopus sinensis]|uniref:Magnesium-dependent phosphatase 1 isoform X1 n=1 Tax=Octopus sinensis TaxID=2607531 RepID=A0A6P7S8H4_9MOLL|nr:magnesium-dependent phosphatase 1 isoform X1 [Octopus sinensis]
MAVSYVDKPKLIVFDLDYTLWPFWVDTHVSPPFELRKDKVYDSLGDHVTHFPEVPEVLQSLQNEGYKLGVASRTGAIKSAKQLMDLFNWSKYFEFSEIYPGDKTIHFSQFHKHSNIPYEDMLFFDDEGRNVTAVGNIGVTAIHVHKNTGVTKEVMEEGLKKFAENKKKAAS